MKKEELDKFGKGKGQSFPDTPEGYFDGLEERVIQRWKEEKAPKTSNGRVRVIGYALMTVAAAVAMVFFFRPISTENPKLELMNALSDEDLVAYYIQAYDESPTDLMMDVSDMPLDTLEDWVINEIVMHEEAIQELY